MSLRYASEAAMRAALVRNRQPEAPRPVSRPRVTSSTTAALGTLLQTIQRLARQHGWEGMHTYNAHGPDTGLHIMLVRDVLLFAEVTLTKDRLSALQQRWLQALRASGKAEVYIWGPEDLDAIRARITQPLAKETP
jgi:hypothetical protein